MKDATSVRRYPPVRKSVMVNAPPERAFRRFTEEMGVWWPLATHSVGGHAAETVAMEGHVGGRILERLRDGGECVWGTVTAWEPPRRVAFTWHPGRDASTAQDVEVRFHAAGERTRVQLVHSGFERLGPLARKARAGYPLGWVYVLGLYAERRDPVMRLVSGLTSVLMAVLEKRARGSHHERASGTSDLPLKSP